MENLKAGDELLYVGDPVYEGERPWGVVIESIKEGLVKYKFTDNLGSNSSFTSSLQSFLDGDYELVNKTPVTDSDYQDIV